MKKIVLFFLLCFNNFIQVKAQLAPLGTLWSYFATHIRDGIPTSHVQLYTITKDTLLAGKVYSEILEDKSNKRFYRTIDSGKVYFWVNEQHNLLFDMNVKVNDTLTVDENNGYDNQITKITHKIDTIYFVKDKKGDSLKVYQTSSRRTFTERALSINDYLSHNYLPHESQVSITINLQCYVEHGKFSFLLLDSSYCDYVTIKEVADIQKQISVYPNPANTSINIELPNNQLQKLNRIQLFDYAGKLILSKNVTTDKTQLNIESISAGLYFLTIMLEDGQIATHKIVTQH